MGLWLSRHTQTTKDLSDKISPGIKSFVRLVLTIMID